MAAAARSLSAKQRGMAGCVRGGPAAQSGSAAYGFHAVQQRSVRHTWHECGMDIHFSSVRCHCTQVFARELTRKHTHAHKNVRAHVHADPVRRGPVCQCETNTASVFSSPHQCVFHKVLGWVSIGPHTGCAVFLPNDSAAERTKSFANILAST